MAMRLLKKIELDALLIKDYGSRKLPVVLPKGEMWENHEERGFYVSPPEEMEGTCYPDWYLDELIQRGNLKFGAKRVRPQIVDQEQEKT
jgi:hypothetical protein